MTAWMGPLRTGGLQGPKRYVCGMYKICKDAKSRAHFEGRTSFIRQDPSEFKGVQQPRLPMHSSHIFTWRPMGFRKYF